MSQNSVGGWSVDLPRLYGALEWKRREDFSLTENLWPVPGHDAAILLYAIGEIGVGKQIGRVAIIVERLAPRTAYQPVEPKLWELGDQTFRFSKDGGVAYCYEFGEAKADLSASTPFSFTCRLRGLDLRHGLVGRSPQDSSDFELRPDEITSLVWAPWA